MVFIPYSLQPLGAQYSTDTRMGAGVLSGRVPCVPAMCLYIAKTWQGGTSQEPAGGAGPQTSALGCVHERARHPHPHGAWARTGGAACPFKETGRTTRTFLPGGGRVVLFRPTRTTLTSQKTISFPLQRWPASQCCVEEAVRWRTVSVGPFRFSSPNSPCGTVLALPSDAMFPRASGV